MSQGESLSPSDGAFDGSNDETRTTTRADLAEAIHRRTGLGRAESAKYVEMVLEEIFTSIVTRNDVKLSSFGAFIVRAKRERQGRNPKTGQEAKITARLVVTFKPSNVLRDRVNNGFGNAEGDGKVDDTGNDKIAGKAKGKGNNKGNDKGIDKAAIDG